MHSRVFRTLFRFYLVLILWPGGAPFDLIEPAFGIHPTRLVAQSGEKSSHVFTLDPDRTETRLDGRAFLVVGVRVSNALISDEKTERLIDNMDLFASYGVNTFSVFFQGSRFGDVRGYREDTTLDPVYAARMGRIIEAADKRGMVVLVGCLYYGNSRGKWESWRQEDASSAVANTVRWLGENGYRNVFLDVNNEHMADFDDAGLIAAGRAVDSRFVIGASGKETPANTDLSLHHGERDLPKIPYLESEGDPSKYWGAYSKRKDLYNYINIGVYTEEMKEEVKKDSSLSLENGIGYIAASTWLQCVPPDGPNHHPGGMGTEEDPGVRWWLEHIRSIVGPYK